MGSKEINKGYLEFIQDIGRRSRTTPWNLLRSTLGRIVFLGYLLVRLLAVPLLLIYVAILGLYLKLRLRFAGGEIPDLHREAVAYIPRFVRQYPLHLYPIVAKSLEMAFINRHLTEMQRRAVEADRPIIEFAVGEGTLSGRVFPADAEVTAFDLNPYSLVHTRNYSHIVKRVVADCLNPPVGKCSASFLLCNNLLHHVTEKRETIESWAEVTEYCITNENTGYWASSWALPYFLRKLGLSGLAAMLSRSIEVRGLQALSGLPELRAIVESRFEVLEQESFMHERVFFFCAICSSLMICQGPPTPAVLKSIFNGPLRFVAHRLTRWFAELLIMYDGTMPRDKDAFVNWLLRSKQFKQSAGTALLACPECGAQVNGQICEECKREYPIVDGMLFLLDDSLRERVLEGYSGLDGLPSEHL